jgi:flagellar hook-basal body complex protein FliE
MTNINMSTLKIDAMANLDTKIKLPLPQSNSHNDFGAHLKNALSEVAGLETKATKLMEAFETGEETDVTKVMLAREKSSMAFEATLQIRNKLLSAYKDIISMPV